MTATARPSAAVITEESRDFSDAWPAVFTTVVRSLRRRGVDLHTAEDAAQEAGTRAFDLQIPFQDADHLRRWVLVAARRIAIDTARHQARLDHRAQVDVLSREDVPAEAEGRLRLDAARRAFRELSAVDRLALVDDTKPATRKEAVRLAVRRHRARAHLLRLVEGVAVVIGILWRRSHRAATVVAIAAMPVLAWTMAVPDAGGTGEAPPRPAPLLVTSDVPAGAGVPPAPQPVTTATAGDGAAADAARAAADAGAARTPPVAAAEIPGPGPAGDTRVSVDEKRPEDRSCVWHRDLGVEVCAPDVDVEPPG